MTFSGSNDPTGPGGETGDLTRFLVSSKRSPGAKLHGLAGKFVIVALM
jgi:hypothetical protein